MPLNPDFTTFEEFLNDCIKNNADAFWAEQERLMLFGKEPQPMERCMSQDLEVLIARVAEARKSEREVSAVAKAANEARQNAISRLEGAYADLRAETHRRINELVPPQDGDPIVV
jgi:hypothetical protein